MSPYTRPSAETRWAPETPGQSTATMNWRDDEASGFEEKLEQLTQSVIRNPAAAIAIALATGVMLGWLIKR